MATMKMKDGRVYIGSLVDLEPDGLGKMTTIENGNELIYEG